MCSYFLTYPYQNDLSTSSKFLLSLVSLTGANLRSGEMNSKTGRCELIVTPERKCMEQTADEGNNRLNGMCCCLSSYSQHPDFFCLFPLLLLGFFLLELAIWGKDMRNEELRI